MSLPESSEALVEELLSEVVDSFEKLELIVACVSAARHTLESLAESLKGDPHALRHEVQDLVDAGVLVADGATYSIRPDGKWTRHVAALAATYASDRMHVVTLMSNAAMRRLRANAAQVFSDAFLIGRGTSRGPKDGR